MNSGAQEPTPTHSSPEALLQEAQNAEYTRLLGPERIDSSDLPIFIRLGAHATTYYALIDPAKDLQLEARQSAVSGAKLNPDIRALLIQPRTFSMDTRAGYKALRPEETVVLGRSHQEQTPRFTPFDDGVSRTHASITESSDGKSFIIQDLGSMNGTYVSGIVPITEVPITEETVPTPIVKVERKAEVEVYGASIASEGHGDANEDALLVDHAARVYAVFDGVGGGPNGQLASSAARDFLSRSGAEIQQHNTSIDEHENALRKELYYTNKHVQEIGQGGEATAVLVTIHQTEGITYASVAHAGDSRAYLLRDGHLEMLTLDHSLWHDADSIEVAARQKRLAELTNPGDLLPEDRNAFRSRNVITSSLGTNDPLVDVSHHRVLPGDRLLLSTDGIHDNLTNSEIQKLLAQGSSRNAADLLVKQAKKRSKTEHFRAKDDDMTAVVIAI